MHTDKRENRKPKLYIQKEGVRLTLVLALASGLGVRVVMGLANRDELSTEPVSRGSHKGIRVRVQGFTGKGGR